ncbi:MAG: EAL domain-containing protein [Candidatus Delongbacteria bacterium]|nr:EAL domain-containing protein [Candidatus Delongbacteria bacterium]MBN2833669.1 EAL domain-containing protein [Candidatus Delongbacteria bacterium]
MDIFVARQPIFNKDLTVYAYELLFRSGFEKAVEIPDQDIATSNVIHRSFVDIGLDDLVGGKRVFINFTDNLLKEEIASLFPPELLTVEVLENVIPDKKIIESVINLKKKGYLIALDDFEYKDLNNPLIPHADIIKVDFMLTTEEEQFKIVQMLKHHNIKFLAEKIETRDIFEKALEWGYTYFQGFFLAKPEIKKGRGISSNKMSKLNLLIEVNKSELMIENIETIIKHDVNLSFKLLKFMNSPHFGFKREINSIKHALNLLGQREVKKWINIITLNDIGDDKPAEITREALRRGKFLENIGLINKNCKDSSEFFFLGMFSKLDCIVGLPMDQILKDFPISTDVKNAILGVEDSNYKKLLDLIINFDKGDWELVHKTNNYFKLSEPEVVKSYKEAVSWSDLIMNSNVI